MPEEYEGRNLWEWLVEIRRRRSSIIAGVDEDAARELEIELWCAGVNGSDLARLEYENSHRTLKVRLQFVAILACLFYSILAYIWFYEIGYGLSLEVVLMFCSVGIFLNSYFYIQNSALFRTGLARVLVKLWKISHRSENYRFLWNIFGQVDYVRLFLHWIPLVLLIYLHSKINSGSEGEIALAISSCFLFIALQAMLFIRFRHNSALREYEQALAEADAAFDRYVRQVLIKDEDWDRQS